MADLIAVPWWVTAVAILECGHSVPLDADAARYYCTERTLTGWMGWMSCRQSNIGRQVIDLIVRTP